MVWLDGLVLHVEPAVASADIRYGQPRPAAGVNAWIHRSGELRSSIDSRPAEVGLDMVPVDVVTCFGHRHIERGDILGFFKRVEELFVPLTLRWGR